MRIRAANVKDLSVLRFNDRHIREAELENILRLNRVYIAEEEGNLKGWLRYNLFWDNTPFMNMLYVLEDSRGEGVGRRLVEYWEEQMRRLGYKTVMTSTSSHEYAQHFYVKLGYEAVGGFLPKGEAYEIILTKQLGL